MIIQPDDTLASCLNRVLKSGDAKEPIAQYVAEILQHFGGAGGGGGAAGVPEAPTDGNLYGRENAAWAPVPTGGGVQNPSTAQIVVKGDQFSFDPAAAQPRPAFMMSDAAGTAQVGIAISQYGDSVTFVKANGQPAGLRMISGSFAQIPYATGILMIGSPYWGLDFSDGGGWHVAIGPNNTNGDFLIKTTNANSGIQLDVATGTIVGRIRFDQATGDLIVSQSTGPNAGKSVNLTAGKWA
jgi:hypothetical protein